MFTDKPMPWAMVGIGVLIGGAVLVIDQFLKRSKAGFRAHVMPLAVGIYLPMGLAVAMLIGGFVSLAVKRIAARRGDADAADHRGILFGSGLIAGEAVAAIIIAFLLVGLGKNEAGESRLPIEIVNNWAVSLAFFAAAIAVILYVALRTGRARGSAEKKG
jgi:uncharacterized oligopeptide transporter (OPT) family protein